MRPTGCFAPKTFKYCGQNVVKWTILARKLIEEKIQVFTYGISIFLSYVALNCYLFHHLRVAQGSQYLKVLHLIQKTPCKIEVRSRYSLFRPRTRHRRTKRASEMLLLPRGPFNSNLPTSNHAERKRGGSSRENKTERGSGVSCIFFETEYLGPRYLDIGTHNQS